MIGVLLIDYRKKFLPPDTPLVIWRTPRALHSSVGCRRSHLRRPLVYFASFEPNNLLPSVNICAFCFSQLNVPIFY